MQRSEHDPDEGVPSAPRSEDVPPVGEALVRSRHRPVAPVPAVPEPDAVPAGPMAGLVGLVAGATSSLGGAFGAALAARGARVCLLDRDLVSLRRLAERLGGTDATMVLDCDPVSLEDLTDAVSFLTRAGVRPDLVVHAGADAPGEPAGLLDAVERHYAEEVRGPLALNERLVPLLDPGSSVVFVGMQGAGAPEPGPVRIAAAARHEVVETVRADMAGREVRVLSVSVVGDVGGGPGSDESGAGDVASISLDLLDQTGAADVTHLTVDTTTGASVAEAGPSA